MGNSTKIFRLKGKVQHYAWGGTDFIPDLLKEENPGKKPFAEYWMGAHDNVPAEIVHPGDGTQPLNEFIKNNPEKILGAKVFNRFGRLPYLFKVQDVKDILSIQVHPSKESAEAAYAEESKKGIPTNDPTRNYKDDNHKPELMLALGDFWLLHGFKPPEQLQAVLKRVPELNFLLPVFEKDGYAGLYKTVMVMEQSEVNRHLQPLMDRIVPLYDKGSLKKDQEDFWAARAAASYNKEGRIDRGIFSIYLFNVVHLHPGEAVFQDAGIPHAYMEGRCMEIMANSDNVLRGGLTPKHVDINELLKHVKFEPVVPNIIKGVSKGEGIEIFPTPVFDFEMHRIIVKKDKKVQLAVTTAEIFFVYEGAVAASSGSDKLELKRGESMLAVAGAEIELTGLEDARVFRATTPV